MSVTKLTMLTLVLTVAGLFAQAASAPTASALFGRGDHEGFFTGIRDTRGDQLVPGGIDNVTDAGSFVAEIQTMLNGTNPRCSSMGAQRCAVVAAFIINTMMGIDAPTATIETARNNERAWTSRVFDYQEAGLVDFNAIVTYPVGSGNTFWQGNGGGGSNPNDVASYINKKSYNDKPSIVFTNPDGSKYWIKKECANPMVLAGETVGPLVELRANTQISSQVSNTALNPGDPVSDTVNVVGDPAVGFLSGQITFELCGPTTPGFDPTRGCMRGPLGSGAFMGDIPLAGANTNKSATSNTANPTEPGTYCYYLFYGGNTRYSQKEHVTTTNECFTVYPVSLDVNSNFILGPLEQPGIGSDLVQVLVSPAQDPATGTINYFLCRPGDAGFDPTVGCAAGGTAMGSATVDAQGFARSPSTTPEQVVAPGTYCFRAEYSGNAGTLTEFNNTTQCFTIPKIMPTLVTNSDVDGTNDNLQLSGPAGVPAPTGTVEFFLCTPGQTTPDFEDDIGCQGGTSIGTTNVDANGFATSPTVDPALLATIGKYCWSAAYSGDDNYFAFRDSNPDLAEDSPTGECFRIYATPTVVTTSTPSPTGQPGVWTDKVTITGPAGDPTVATGTMTFFLCTPGQAGYDPNVGCASGGTQIGAAKTLDANAMAESDPTTFEQTMAYGKYCWRGEYSGDDYFKALADYNAVVADPPNVVGECFEVAPQTPELITFANPNPEATIYTDLGIITGTEGFPEPTGTVTYFMCSPGQPGFDTSVGCAEGGILLCEAVPLDENGRAESCPTTPEQTAAPGIYCFRGVYSGDSIYAPLTEYNPLMGNADANIPGECFDPQVLAATGHTSFFGTIVAGIASVVSGATALISRRWLPWFKPQPEEIST